MADEQTTTPVDHRCSASSGTSTKTTTAAGRGDALDQLISLLYDAARREDGYENFVVNVDKARLVLDATDGNVDRALLFYYDMLMTERPSRVGDWNGGDETNENGSNLRPNVASTSAGYNTQQMDTVELLEEPPSPSSYSPPPPFPPPPTLDEGVVSAVAYPIKLDPLDVENSTDLIHNDVVNEIAVEVTQPSVGKADEGPISVGSMDVENSTDLIRDDAVHEITVAEIQPSVEGAADGSLEVAVEEQKAEEEMIVGKQEEEQQQHKQQCNRRSLLLFIILALTTVIILVPVLAILTREDEKVHPVSNATGSASKGATPAALSTDAPKTTTRSSTPDPCLPNPCQNGGQCGIENDGMNYNCSCPLEFTGLNCGLHKCPCYTAGEIAAEGDNITYCNRSVDHKRVEFSDGLVYHAGQNYQGNTNKYCFRGSETAGYQVNYTLTADQRAACGVLIVNHCLAAGFFRNDSCPCFTGEEIDAAVVVAGGSFNCTLTGDPNYEILLSDGEYFLYETNQDSCKAGNDMSESTWVGDLTPEEESACIYLIIDHCRGRKLRIYKHQRSIRKGRRRKEGFLNYSLHIMN